MSLAPSRSLLLGAFVLLAADVPSYDVMAFAPKAEMVVKKTFATKVEMVVDDMSAVMNGEEMDPSMMGLPSDLSAEASMNIEVEDTYDEVNGARITSLTRTFDTIGGAYTTSMGEADEASFDELEGRTIHFKWNAEDEIYEVTFEGDEAPSEEEEKSLQMIDADMDYLALLPEGDVEVGAKWDIDGLEVLSILMPGASLKQLMASDQMSEDVPAEVQAQIDAFLESAKASLTYAGSEEGIGTIAIAMNMEFDTTIDPSTMNPEAEMPAEMLFEVEFSLEIEGKLNWDMASGHFTTCDLEGTGSLILDVEMTMAEMGMDIESFIQVSLGLEHSGKSEVQ